MIPDGLHILIRLSGRRIIVSTSTCSIVIILVKSKNLTSSNHNLRAFGERVALNMPIQGTAADIMKLAMVAVARRLQAERPDARLVLQVHDELIVECPAAEAEAVARLLEEEMENVVHLSVPLTAQAHWGKNWLEAKG